MHTEKTHTHIDAGTDREMQIIFACMLRDSQKGTDRYTHTYQPSPRKHLTDSAGGQTQHPQKPAQSDNTTLNK